MQSTFLISLALFSALSLAAQPVIDPAVVRLSPPIIYWAQLTSLQESDVIDKLEKFGTSVLNDPALASELGATPSDIAEFKDHLPKIESDLEAYAGSVIKSPQFTSVVDVLATIVPTGVQSQIEANPGEFIVSLVTETSLPAYISAIPTGAQSYIISVADHIVSEVEDDLSAPKATQAPGPYTYSTRPSGKPYPSSGYPRPSGTGFATGTYGPSGRLGSKPAPTASSRPFTGAASSLRSTAAGVAAVLAGVAALMML